MDRAQYLDLLRSDGELLRATAAGDLTLAVPPCPGWTISDVVRHTAEVYEHKMACIRLGGAQPHPWPPSWPADLDPLAWFADAHSRLLTVLAETDPSAPSWTWWPEEQTASFWVRRMAQETAVHRADVQSAVGALTPIDRALALDGIDEVLQMMLAGDWSDVPQPGSTGYIAVTADGRGWTVHLRPSHIEVLEGDQPADAHVGGSPSDLLLWLWGRLPDSAVTASSELAAVRLLRQRLALATG